MRCTHTCVHCSIAYKDKNWKPTKCIEAIFTEGLLCDTEETRVTKQSPKNTVCFFFSDETIHSHLKSTLLENHPTIRALFPAFQLGSIIVILSRQTAHEGC